METLTYNNYVSGTKSALSTDCEPPKYACSICNELFPSKDSMLIHYFGHVEQRSHEGTSTQQDEANILSTTIAFAHVTTETSFVNFEKNDIYGPKLVCSTCEGTYASEMNLKLHKEMAHGNLQSKKEPHDLNLFD